MQATQEIKQGDRVSHYRLGLGTIEYVDNTTYSLQMVSIKFDNEDWKVYIPSLDVEKVN